MDKEKTLNLIKTLLISATIVTVWAALEHFGIGISCLIINGEINTNCFVQNVQERVFGTFGQPNWLAAYLVAISPLAWYQTFNKKVDKRIYFILSIVIFTTLLFTKSRSGLLGFAVTILIFWMPNIKKHLSVFMLTTFCLLLATLLFWNPFNSTSVKETSEAVVSDNLGGTESGEIRKIVWRGAIDLWKRYPLLGTGVETFAYSYYETRPIEHNNTSEWNYLYNKAHNEYLNFAATTGTIGLSSYLMFIIASLAVFFKNKHKLINLALAAGYISILVTNFFGFSTVSIAVLFFLFPAMAISLNIPEIKIKKIKYKNSVYLFFIGITTIYLMGNLAKYWLADYYYAKGNAKRAGILSPNEPLYRIELAKIFAEEGDAISAEQEINIVKHSASRNVKILKEVANVYGDLAEIDDSYLLKEHQQLQDLSTLAPTDVQIKYQLALSFGKIGNIEESKQEVLNAIEMKPDYKIARKYLANIYLSQSKPQKTKEQYEYILKYISPEDEEIKNALDNLK